jgi:hypothetical protein
MDLNESKALEQLVLRNHHCFLDGDQPAICILCFDADGRIVPWDRVFAASPQDSFPSVRPTPGVGYYAHLRRRVAGFDAAATEWEVRGPDWQATVRLHGEGPLAMATACVNRESEGGKRFLRLLESRDSAA